MPHRPLRLPFSRRAFLMGAAALTATSAFPATPACSLAAEQEEGPYYIEDEAMRRDITEGRAGVPLLLAVRLVDAKRCTPLTNAALDIWHCDAAGIYSGFTAMSPDSGPGGPRGMQQRPPGPPPGAPRDGFRGGMPQGPGGPPRGPRQIDSTRFLRGVQVTNSNGLAEFATVYPGWYSGRAIHIHLKVRVGGVADTKYSEGHVAHTGQLYLPEDLTERVAQLKPYANRLQVHRTTQAEDGIYKSQHGAESLLTIERLGKKDEDGFRGVVTLGIDSEATPKAVGGRGPRG